MNTTQDLRQALRDNGTSFADFAERNGYKYRTVCIVAQRWWHRKDREPHGGLARLILDDLKKETQGGGENK